MNRLLASSCLLWLVGCGVPDRVDSTFSFEKDAFSFANFDTTEVGGQMSPALAERLFGTEAVCASGTGATCVPTDHAQAWIDDVNVTLSSGHSEGMAVLALLMSRGDVASSDFGATTAAGLVPTPSVRDELAYWSATQKMDSAHAADQKFQAKDVVRFLANALSPTRKPAFRLLITMKSEKGFYGGHALVPFGYFKDARDGVYQVRVYDPSFPATERRLEVDTKKNTWTYEGSANPDAPRTYFGDGSNGNLLQFSPVTSRLGQFVAPFSSAGSLALSANGANVLLESDGVSVGLGADGTVHERGGHVFPGAADCQCKVPNAVMNVTLSPDAGTGAQTISVSPSDYSSGKTGVNVSGPGVSVSTGNVSSSGTITVDSSSKTVTVAGGAGSPVTVVIQNADGSTTKVSVNTSAGVSSITIDASNPNAVTVKVDVPAGQTGTNVSVTTTTTASDGSSKSVTTAGTSTGQDVQITSNPSNGTGTANTNINLSTCKNGKKDADESGIDCGQTCAAKGAVDRYGTGLCGLDAGCGAQADCDRDLWCVGGACKGPSCTDSIKNGDETDVDCGASACLCAAGKTCATNANCQAGLVCNASKQCAHVYTTTLTITGLGEGFTSTFTSRVDYGATSYNSLTGKTGGAALVYTFKGTTALNLAFPFSGSATEPNCVFTGGSQYWNWTSAAAPADQTVTATCTQTSAVLGWKTAGTGICVSPSGATSGTYYSSTEVFPNAPTVSGWYNSRSRTNADQVLTFSQAAQQGAQQTYQIDAVMPVQDGGSTAWQMTIGAAVDDWSRNPSTWQKMNRYQRSCSANAPLSGGVPSSPRYDVPITCNCTWVETFDAGPQGYGPVGETCWNPLVATLPVLAAATPPSGQYHDDYGAPDGGGSGCATTSGTDYVYSVDIPPANRLTARIGTSIISNYQPTISVVDGPADNCASPTRTCLTSARATNATPSPSVSVDNTSSTTRTVFIIVDDGFASSIQNDHIGFTARLTSIAVPDAGPADAGAPDAGAPDAGAPDAGAPDAGVPDAGAPDAGGPVDAGPAACTTDSACGSGNCYCGDNSGNCAGGTGTCGPALKVISTATDGTAVSGAYAVPTGCTTVHVSAWGAAGGNSTNTAGFGNLGQSGGAGGFVSGTLTVTAGTQFQAWIGVGGIDSKSAVGGEGVGSYLGTAASGGAGDMIDFTTSGGGGGGLTSVSFGSANFSVPGGGGAGATVPGNPAGGTGAGSASTKSGGAAAVVTGGGGGGAGENGGNGTTASGGAGDPGAYGTLPTGLTSQVGNMGTPPGTSTSDYALCPTDTATAPPAGSQGGNGCVVLRCAP